MIGAGRASGSTARSARSPSTRASTATFATDFASYAAGVGFRVATYPHVPAEPELAPYVLADPR